MRHSFGKQRLCILSGRRMLTLLGNASQCSESHKLSWETLATSCQCLKKIMSCDPHRNRKYLFKVQGDNARMQTWRTKSKQDSNSNANDPLNLHDRNLSCYSDIFPGSRIISIIWILLSISSEDYVCKGERQIFIFGRCDQCWGVSLKRLTAGIHLKSCKSGEPVIPYGYRSWQPG